MYTFRIFLGEYHAHPSTVSPVSLSPLEYNKSTIHMLPDYVLLEIFDHCRGDDEHFTPKMWKPLVHVCQRWRQIIFASPRRLHLLLVCDVRTPVRKLLDIWPLLPIAILYSPKDNKGEENVVAAFKRHSWVSWIVFDELTSPILEKFAAVMQNPFPALKGLHLQSFDEMGPVIPDSFLGGSAPQLQVAFLEGIAFPALPRLVVSAAHLTKLWLQRIPDTGYIDPEVMATCLTALPRLEEFHIGYQSPQSGPFQISSPSPTQSLPALTFFAFRGDSKYLECLISRISAPNLDSLNLWFFIDIVSANPQLCNFISSAERLRPFKRAYMELYPWSARITFGSPTSLDLGTKCDRLDQQISWMAQLCNGLSLLLSHVECLEISGDADSQVDLQDGMESTQWLELFHAFTAVQNLYVSKKLGPFVTRALQELTGERAVGVLPSLCNLSFGGLGPCGSVDEAIESFVAARRLLNRPVVVERWEQDRYQDLVDDY